jgi:hypothetical protein
MNRKPYEIAVTSCKNHLALGALWPSLPCAEKWCAKHHGMQIGGNATEAAFDALLAFGLTVEEIQNGAGIR